HLPRAALRRDANGDEGVLLRALKTERAPRGALSHADVRGGLLRLHALGILKERTVRVNDVAVEVRGCAAVVAADVRRPILAAGDDRVDLRCGGRAPRLVDVHLPGVAPTIFQGKALDVRRCEIVGQVGEPGAGARYRDCARGVVLVQIGRARLPR